MRYGNEKIKEIYKLYIKPSNGIINNDYSNTYSRLHGLPIIPQK